MTEYINREAAIEAVAYRLAINKDDYERAERQAVDWLPEAEEDVVEVVRCKDCKYWKELLPVCERIHRAGWGVNDYCSFGERAES